MPKLYTKTGDAGSTGLGGGERISKHSPRIGCIGEIDELNACIGLCATVADVVPPLQRVQDELFIIGSYLAAGENANIPGLNTAVIARLESEIDAMDAVLPPLRNFILPGGCELAARLHLARTVCRRAERALVALSSSQALDSLPLIYLNRLSDWLFASARHANQTAGVADIIWKSPEKP
jgi:cob(I)alamin adenosyltransferase